MTGSIEEPSDARAEDKAIHLAGRNASFERTISVRFGGEVSDVKLQGKLSLGGDTVTLDESIRCKTMIGL